MWRTVFVALTLLFLTLNGSVAKQQLFTVKDMTVKDMIAYCVIKSNETSVEKQVSASYCYGMAIGVMGTLEPSKTENTFYKTCATSYYSGEQLSQIFLNWAEKNPKHWQLPAAYGFIVALMEAFPCPK
jgi:hypothetical protein